MTLQYKFTFLQLCMIKYQIKHWIVNCEKTESVTSHDLDPPLPPSQTVTLSQTPSPLERDILYGRPLLCNCVIDSRNACSFIFVRIVWFRWIVDFCCKHMLNLCENEKQANGWTFTNPLGANHLWSPDVHGIRENSIWSTSVPAKIIHPIFWY